MKKLVFAGIFLLFQASLFAQENPRKINTVGIDVGKNLPYLFFPTVLGGKNALIIEPTVQFTTPKPNRFLNLTVGYTKIDQETSNGRILHYLRGFHLQLMKERQSQDGKSFWAYGGLVAVATGKGDIQVKGNYFPTYLTPLPAFSGAGIGGKFQYGKTNRISANWLLRMSLNIGFNLSEYGQPNAAYLPGAGPLAVQIHSFSETGGLNFQLFYSREP